MRQPRASPPSAAAAPPEERPSQVDVLLDSLTLGLAVWLSVGVVAALFSGVLTFPILVLGGGRIVTATLRSLGRESDRLGCTPILIGIALWPLLLVLAALVLAGLAVALLAFLTSVR